MSFRIIAQSVFNNPGNRDRKLRKALAACWWQIRKRVTSNPQMMILANGVRFQAYPHCVVSSSLHYADWPEYHELRFCRERLRHGQVVIDVGANVGHFSLLIADLVGPENVYCFEPGPAAYNRLVQNFQINGWPTEHLFQVAVGRAEGTVLFPDSDHPVTTNAIQTNRAFNTIEVTLSSLDSVFEEFRYLEIGLLKVDVEGYEAEVFAGARRMLATTRPKLIMFESLSGRPDPTIETLLEEQNYALFDLGPNGAPRRGNLRAQNLFSAPLELTNGWFC